MKARNILFTVLAVFVFVGNSMAQTSFFPFVYFQNDTVFVDGHGYPVSIVNQAGGGCVEIGDSTGTAVGSYRSGKAIDDSMAIHWTAIGLNTDEINYVGSPMVVTGGEVTEGTNAGTYKVAALTALFRTTDSDIGDLVLLSLAEQDNQAITAVNTTYFISLNYNDGVTPTVTLVASNPYVADKRNFPIGKVMKDGSDNVHYVSGGYRLNDGVQKFHVRTRALRAFELASGATIAYSGTNNFTSEAATVYGGINAYSLASYNSATTTFVPVYSDGGGGWTYGTPRNTIDYANYDGGAGALVAIGNAKYGTHWVYRHIDDGDVYVRYGEGSYSLAAAEDEQEPSKPTHLTDFGILIGKIVAPQAGGSFTTIQMVNETFFTGTATSDHGNLTGLADNDHPQYALDTDVIKKDGSVDYTDDQDFGGNYALDLQNISDIGSGMLGGSYSFDGVDDYQVIADDAKIQNIADNGMTVGAWIYPRSDGENSSGKIIDKRNGWALGLKNESGGFVAIQMYIDFSGSAGNFITTVNVPVDTWSFISAEYNSGNISNIPIIRKNGVALTLLTSTAPTGTRTTDVGSDLYIGNNSTGSSTFDGIIAGVFADNRILSADELKERWSSSEVKPEHVGASQTALNTTVFANNVTWPWDTFAGASATGFTVTEADGSRAITSGSYGFEIDKIYHVSYDYITANLTSTVAFSLGTNSALGVQIINNMSVNETSSYSATFTVDAKHTHYGFRMEAPQNGDITVSNFNIVQIGGVLNLARGKTPGGWIDDSGNNLNTVISGSTLNNVQEKAYYPQGVEIDSEPTIDHYFNGPSTTMTVGENVVFGEALYIKSDGKLWKADASVSTTMPGLFLASATILADADGVVIMPGAFVRDDTWTWTVGASSGAIYVSLTSGELTQTAPSVAGEQVQIVGYATHADRIFFFPSPDVGEI